APTAPAITQIYPLSLHDALPISNFSGSNFFFGWAMPIARAIPASSTVRRQPKAIGMAASANAPMIEINVVMLSPYKPKCEFLRATVCKPDRKVNTHNTQQDGQQRIDSDFVPCEVH